MKYTFYPQGVCSVQIDFELENGIIHNVVFTSGCNGNLKAIAKLTEGKPAAEIAAILKGNTCGYKSTSCADQFSKALEEAMNQEAAR